MSTPNPTAPRPSVIQLAIKEKAALYAAYIPLFQDGGVFIPTTRDYKLGEDIYLLLALPEDMLTARAEPEQRIEGRRAPQRGGRERGLRRLQLEDDRLRIGRRHALHRGALKGVVARARLVAHARRQREPLLRQTLPRGPGRRQLLQR